MEVEYTLHPDEQDAYFARIPEGLRVRVQTLSNVAAEQTSHVAPASTSALRLTSFDRDIDAVKAVGQYTQNWTRSLARAEGQGYGTGTPREYLELRYELQERLLQDTRVPVFGSPPEYWDRLKDVVPPSLYAGGALVSDAVPQITGGLLLLAGSTAIYTTIIKPGMLDPTGVGVGAIVALYWDHLRRRVERRLDQNDGSGRTGGPSF